MKITIDIPEWAQERIICILAGIELLAFKPARENKLYVKQIRCNECGKCCMNLERHPLPVVDGQCVYLRRRPGTALTYHCSLGGFRPYACCSRDPIYMDECCITHEVIDIDG